MNFEFTTNAWQDFEYWIDNDDEAAEVEARFKAWENQNL